MPTPEQIEPMLENQPGWTLTGGTSCGSDKLTKVIESEEEYVLQNARFVATTIEYGEEQSEDVPPVKQISIGK